MRRLAACVAGVLIVSSCSPAVDIEPIPGSITYGGQPRDRLVKSPVGSRLQHRFVSGNQVALETYVLQPDRSLKLIRRTYINDWPLVER